MFSTIHSHETTVQGTDKAFMKISIYNIKMYVSKD